MPTELDVMVDKLTKKIADLEQQAKSSEAKARGALHRAEQAELDAVDRIATAKDTTARTVAQIEAELHPYQERQQALLSVTKQLDDMKRLFHDETHRLKAERHQQMAELADQIATQSQRLATIHQAIATCKSTVSEV